MERWSKTTLGEACLIRPAKREAKAKLDGQDEVSFVPMEALGIRKKDFDGTQAKPLNKVYGGYTYFADGDVLLAKITPCFQNGKLGIASGLKNGTGFGSSEFFVFRCSDQLDKEFLFYFLSQEKFVDEGVAQMSGAVGHQRVPLEFIEQYPISLPPLPEQERIVAILDEAFVAIATATTNAEKNLANARELFESDLHTVFVHQGEGWINTRLGELSETLSGGTPLRSRTEYWGGEIPWYSSGELNNLLTSVPKDHITSEGLDGSNAKLFPKGALLIGMYDTAALKMSLLDRDAAFNQAIAGVKPSGSVNLEFVLYSIIAIKTEILSLRRGVRQKNLSLRKIQDIVIPVPPLSEQEATVHRIRALRAETSRLESVFSQRVASLAELKQSILSEAFTGNLAADHNAADRTPSEVGV